jgi:hypothetical protein
MWKKISNEEYLELQEPFMHVESALGEDRKGRFLSVTQTSRKSDLILQHEIRPNFSVCCWVWEYHQMETTNEHT